MLTKLEGLSLAQPPNSHMLEKRRVATKSHSEIEREIGEDSSYKGIRMLQLSSDPPTNISDVSWALAAFEMSRESRQPSPGT